MLWLVRNVQRWYLLRDRNRKIEFEGYVSYLLVYLFTYLALLPFQCLISFFFCSFRVTTQTFKLF
jgi:hypothetical protein